MAKIIYTHTDEAPMLATYSFLPIIAAYAKTAGVDVETRDISLAGRVIAQFPDRLTEEHEIQVLRRAGHSLGETAKLVGVSQSTVQRVEAESAVASFDTEAERTRRRVGRPSKAEPMRSFLIAQLAQEPDVMALELLRRSRLQGYTGGKSALYVLVKELRPERPKTIVRFEGLPGEFSQHDFGHVDVRYVDGSRKFVEPEQDSVLHRLQADLLHGRVRTSPTNPRLRSDDDREQCEVRCERLVAAPAVGSLQQRATRLNGHDTGFIAGRGSYRSRHAHVDFVAAHDREPLAKELGGQSFAVRCAHDCPSSERLDYTCSELDRRIHECHASVLPAASGLPSSQGLQACDAHKRGRV